MKNWKYMILCFIIAAVVPGIFLFKKYSSDPQDYPSLAKQRATLAHRPPVTPIRILDSATIVDDLKFLSSDSCEGRGPGSEGHERAVQRIIARMREAGLDSFDGALIHSFDRTLRGKLLQGKNIIGWIKGTQDPNKYIVITAHYDHLGKNGDSTYYGASDNASGTACILAMANYFKHHPQAYSLIFVAFDMEETGLRGSRDFMNHLPAPVTKENIKLNLNIDMIVRSDNNELFVCGIHHYPTFKDLIRKIQLKTNTNILMGHDKGSGFREDWTNLSDHYAFHLQKVPFLYFGTEDHPDLHRPTDTWEKVDLGTYIENCNMLAQLTTMMSF